MVAADKSAMPTPKRDFGFDCSISIKEDLAAKLPYLRPSLDRTFERKTLKPPGKFKIPITANIAAKLPEVPVLHPFIYPSKKVHKTLAPITNGETPNSKAI